MTVRSLRERVDELLHPQVGVERGLYPKDADDKLINITCGEIRKIGSCLRAVKQHLDAPSPPPPTTTEENHNGDAPTAVIRSE